MKRNRLLCLFVATAVFVAMANAQPARDFSKENARASQEWVKDAVIYQIFPRQYSATGDFNGITKDLDRLKALGVDVLWLMPIHPIGEAKKKGTIGSPYAVRDFYAINPDYGTAADLKRLLAESHRRGMRVIIDVVANHTAWDSVMMKTPAFYTKNERGEIISPVPDWADVADLNYDNPELRKYMIDMLKFWVRDFDLDGFRCDVAGFVPTDFWETARAEVDKVKADTLWLAEWESPDLHPKAFDLDYSWAMHAMLDKVLHGQAAAHEIRKVWEDQASKFPKGTLKMRFSDNHDERRAIARFGEKGALAAQALVFTLDGVPLFYNGLEAGDTTESGAPALFEKRPIFWQFAERRLEMVKFYPAMIALRKGSIALRRGGVTWLKNSDESRVLSFSRKAGNEEIVVVINTSSTPFFGAVEVSGSFDEVTPNAADLANALPSLSLDGHGFRIFKRR
ncbi:MAG: alpha-amylase family glycosyl hydrolase [bacterium]|nr:alpha-amylase family glycosyl hydrolase [bacterium]